MLAAAPAYGQPSKGQKPAPTKEEIRALVERIRVSQHRNDEALAEYERREHRISWKHDGEETDDRKITEDKLYRVVPTGTGTLKLILAEKGEPVTPEYYRKELRELEKALELALRPQDPKQRRAIEKWEKRTRERQEMVDAVPEAFEFTWLGREACDGRLCAKLQLDPNPEFEADSRNQDLFKHIRAVVWVDEAAAQIVRVEAEIFRDISVFGGIFGKVYHGGKFVMEQAKVAEGIWLPRFYKYDFDGRKFIFPFSVNETTEISEYRRIGPPAEALAAVRREISGAAATSKSANASPRN